ncbi:hypothetical protein [Oxynema aestuarii]|jgi:hypothetical protein|uniref:Uncharacterized protein n=1 Tax=Oxynema aestuarii AP17 TaxID=2064643 RepID=A0A6H1TS49_9CYAN|nr:hypothetical protein [Oxynema aestuarii]QIZ69424.1 hypothetical protein HCG48_01520 [Oxynema aestuarii AP17]RMH73149.1 MAG: hypothetical protein D6680_17500 [Cyanobacteria bacterium J007]
MRLVVGGLIATILLWALPVQAQISHAQVMALVEALRLAAPQTSSQEDGLYSPWKIKPSNIPRWSRLCIGEELTPEQFEENVQKARLVVACVMDDILRKEYPESDNNEFTAVRRAASWWVSGDPSLYDRGDIRIYTERVLRFYEELRVTPSDFVPLRVTN